MVAATGIGSGLDIESLVGQLVAAERAPAENRLLQRETRLTSELSAFGTLQGALGGLQSSLESLAGEATFGQRTANSTDTAAVLASVSGDAEVSSFNVTVEELAQSQSLASGAFESLTDEVGLGTLTFRFGSVSASPADAEPQSFDGFSLNQEQGTATLEINSSNNTLQGVRDSINAAEIGISAAIVNDGSGFRLLLSAQSTGAENAVSIEVEDLGDAVDTDNAGLSRLAFNASSNNLLQTVEGRDAQFTINGLSITSATNSVSGVVDGVNLTLRQTSDQPIVVSVTNNEQAVRSAVESFVDSFNNFVSISSNLTAFDASTSSAGPLQGDFTARSVINQLRSTLSTRADGFNGPFTTLSEIGIRTQADGTLSLNENIFSTALSDNFDEIQGLFAPFGQTTDTSVGFQGFSDATQVGSYEIEVTQLATQGALLGAAITAPSVSTPLTIDDSNDSLTFAVNGVSTGAITLTQGDYSDGSSLAAELQARINGADPVSSAGITVSVEFTSDNRLRITSSNYGSESTVSIDAVDSSVGSTLGLSIDPGVDGIDVAGSIGGATATGNGQLLVAADSTDAEGVSLLVTGGSTGPRGQVSFSSGVAVTLNRLVSGFLDSEGVLDLRTDGIEQSVEDITDEREALTLRLDNLEARLRRQFNSLDTLLAGLQTTSDFLTQQLAAIPIPGVDND